MMNISKRVRFNQALPYAAGTATRTGNVIDVRGYDAVAFAVTFGAVDEGAASDVKVQGGALPDGSDMADLEGTTIQGVGTAMGDSNVTRVVDVGHPRQPYLRVVVAKDGTNSSAESAIVLQYSGREEPVTPGEWTDVLHVHAPATVAS